MTDVQGLQRWACAQLGWDESASGMHPVSGDASFRRYFRLSTASGTAVLCDAPPATEKNQEFVAIAARFSAAGIRVPAVLAANLSRGWLCLEDLGDDLLLPQLHAGNVSAYYGHALAMLGDLALVDSRSLGLAPYDHAALTQEMDLFPQWFCAKLLALELSGEARKCFDRLTEALCARALAQVQVVVHRDFHARNLMVLEDGTLATIDFQDALVGPICYDPVSLLRDCYLRWPDEQVRSWAIGHRDALLARGLPVPGDDREYLQDFDWMGLQRHIKVLGIFSRLSIRDDKHAYLLDLPRVMAYTRDVLAAYPQDPAFAGFLAWFDDQVLPRAKAQSWYHRG